MTDLAALSARGLAKAIRDRKVSSLEATQDRDRAIKACHELTNCIITLEADEALADAKAADAAIAAGTPKGRLPACRSPIRTCSTARARSPAGARASAPTSRLPRTPRSSPASRRAGALQIAALHLTEFAFGPTGHNYVLGHARNPWDPTRITGGSSAGTAASVAYGAIPAGIGSDTGGSLRLPRGCLRHRLDQADLGSRQPRRRHAAGAGAGHDRRPRPARRGSRADARVPRRAGPARSGRNQSARARLCRSPRRPRRRPAVGVDEAVVRDAHPDVQRMLEQVTGHPRQARPDASDLPLPRVADARSARAAGAAAGRLGRPQRPPPHACAAITARRCAPASRSGTSFRPSIT